MQLEITMIGISLLFVLAVSSSSVVGATLLLEVEAAEDGLDLLQPEAADREAALLLRRSFFLWRRI